MKLAWRDELVAKIKDFTAMEATGTLPRASHRHPAYANTTKGPFDPTLPLLRKETVASTAFVKFEPSTERGGASVAKVSAELFEKVNRLPAPRPEVQGAAEGSVNRTADVLKEKLTFKPRIDSEFSTSVVSDSGVKKGSDTNTKKHAAQVATPTPTSLSDEFDLRVPAEQATNPALKM